MARTNIQRMERSRKRGREALTPGGHRGRSGQNGAGNHRYTPEEKAMIERERALVQEILDEQKRVKKKAAKHAKNIAKLRQRMLDEKVATMGRNVARLEQKDMGTFVSFKCSKGHTFDRIPRDIITSRGKYICLDCSRSAQGNPRADARVHYSMKLDEQGMDVHDLKTLGEKCTIRDRDTGELFEVFPGNVDRWKRSKDDRQIRFVADDHDHVFVFRGRVPVVWHPFIHYLLETHPIETAEDVRGKPITGIDSMRKVISQFLADGDKVVNLSLNESWQEGGTYTWGKIPEDAAAGTGDNMEAALAGYMKKLREEWEE